MSISVTIDGASATGVALAALGAQLKQPTGVLRVLEREGRNRLVSHFRARNRTPNKLGGRRTNYWQRVADSVNAVRGAGTVTLSISEPTFRQKVLGGPIVPKRAKALTIPVNPKAHGVTARVLEQQLGIKLVLLKTGPSKIGVLAAATSAGSKTLEVFYVLSKGVNQAPDTEALPPQDEFEAALVSRAQGYVARLTSPNP